MDDESQPSEEGEEASAPATLCGMPVQCNPYELVFLFYIYGSRKRKRDRISQRS